MELMGSAVGASKPGGERVSIKKLQQKRVQNFFGYELIGRKGNNEDSNTNSNLGVTADGARSASGAPTDAAAGAK